MGKVHDGEVRGGLKPCGPGKTIKNLAKDFEDSRSTLSSPGTPHRLFTTTAKMAAQGLKGSLQSLKRVCLGGVSVKDPLFVGVLIPSRPQ